MIKNKSIVKGRKIIVSMNVTLDGLMSGPDCELDWHFNCWTTEMAEFMCEQLYKADTLLLGRITYEAMARYWTIRAKDLSCPVEDRAFAEMMNRYTKIVFTNTLTSFSWSNTIKAGNYLESEVLKLKLQPGKNIMIYGSGRLVNSLMQYKLIDEFHLWVHPIALGEGKPLFHDIKEYDNLKLFETKAFRSGVVTCFYTYVRK